MNPPNWRTMLKLSHASMYLTIGMWSRPLASAAERKNIQDAIDILVGIEDRMAKPRNTIYGGTVDPAMVETMKGVRI